MSLFLSGSNQIFRAGQIWFSPLLSQRERQPCFLTWSAIQTSLCTGSPWGTVHWNCLLIPHHHVFCISWLARDHSKFTSPHPPLSTRGAGYNAGYLLSINISEIWIGMKWFSPELLPQSCGNFIIQLFIQRDTRPTATGCLLDTFHVTPHAYKSSPWADEG